MPFDPSSARPIGFDASSATLMDEAKPEPSTLSKVGSYTGAVVGGMANGGADIAEGLGDTPTFILKHLHMISPETANKLYQATANNAKMFRPDSTSSDAISQSVNEHPNVARIAKTGVDLMGLAVGNKMIPTSLLSSGSAAPVVNIAARAAGQGLLGQAAADADHKDAGAVLGMAASPLLEAGGAVLGVLGNKVGATDAVNNVLSSVSNSKIKQAYASIRAMPFSVADSTNKNSAVDDINKFVQTKQNVLTPMQSNVLQDTAETLQNATSHDDVLTALQGLSKKVSIFSGSNATDSVYQGYNNIKNSIGDVLNEAASRNSISDALNSANDIYKQGTQVNKIFGSLPNDPSNFNFKTANTKLTQAITKYQDVPSMQSTVQTLQGLKKVIAPVADKAPNSIYAQHIAGGMIGGVIGGGGGYKEGGTEGAMGGAGLGAAAGVLGLPYAVHSLGKLAQTSGGQAMLRGLNDPGITTKALAAFVRSATAAGIAGTINNKQNDQGNQ